jgi:DNA polymerase III epsilon subunit-like protein
MLILIFDTETTGLPLVRNPSWYDTLQWPHIIQLSFVLWDTEEKLFVRQEDFIIKLAEDVHISPESITFHGITREMSIEKGKDIRFVLREFMATMAKADLIIGHNLIFDKNIIIVESIRNKIPWLFMKPEYCTMKNNTALCALERLNLKTDEIYFKFPTLSELHFKLFGVLPQGTHNSMADVYITMRCHLMVTQNYDIAQDDNYKSIFAPYCILEEEK